MPGKSMNRWSQACVLAAACVVATPALADTFPDKPIKLVVPFTPGGSTDVLGRLLAKKLTDTLNVSVVVENRAGAGTIVGADYVAKSAPMATRCCSARPRRSRSIRSRIRSCPTTR